MDNQEEEKTKFPKHIEKAMFEKRTEFISDMDKNGFSLQEISYIFKISTQRVHKILITNRSKKIEQGDIVC